MLILSYGLSFKLSQLVVSPDQSISRWKRDLVFDENSLPKLNV